MTDVWGEDERPTRRALAVDVGAGVTFGVAMGLVHGGLGAAAVAAAALLGGAIAARRRSWQVMSCLAFAAAVAQVASGQVAYLADAAYLPLFARLGGHPAPGVRRFGLAAAGVSVAVAAGFAAFGSAAPDGPALGVTAASAGLAALTAVFTAGGWVSGYVRWQRRRAVQAKVDAQLQAAERRRIEGLYDIEQERRRIAADMHDVVAHSWAVVAAQSDGARYALRDDPAAAERALEIIGETARTAIDDVRTLVAQLRDPRGAPGIEPQADVVHLMRQSGMTVELRESGVRTESPLVALTAHRLLSESLTNALKHADLEAPVLVEQDWSDGYRLTVTNRIGRPVGRATTHRPGHGLIGMAERAGVSGGTFSAGAEGDEWVVRVQLPRTVATR